MHLLRVLLLAGLLFGLGLACAAQAGSAGFDVLITCAFNSTYRHYG